MTSLKSLAYISINFFFAIYIKADLPELTAINPIEFDEIKQRITASGDATFNYGPVKLRADEIVFYENYGLLNARGNINFTTQNHRLLADSFALGTDSNAFTIDNIKYGYWPYFINAKSGGGTLEEIKLNQGIFYYGEPSIFTPNLKAKSITLVNKKDKKQVIFENTEIRVGNFSIFYLPKIKYDLERNPLFGLSNIGYASEYGPYFQSISLIPIADWFRFGLNLDYYADRGVLIGPIAQYYKQDKKGYFKGSISSGFISDKGPIGTDILNQNIDENRKFFLAQHKQVFKDNLFITAQTHNLSDSELLRDFKESLYSKNQFPLNFFESNYFFENISISSFAHFDTDHFSKTRERLPELSLNLQPDFIHKSQLYHSANLRYAKIKENSISPSSQLFNHYDKLEYSLFDFNYLIGTRHYFNNWLKINPKVELRIIKPSLKNHSNGIFLAPFNQTHNLILYGVDFCSEHEAIYSTKNRLWKIDGLRHLFRPSITFSKLHAYDGERFNLLAQTQLPSTLDLSIPAKSLNDYRNPDQINERTLTRLSFQNFFQTRSILYGSKNLMEFHLTADFYRDYKNRNQNDTIAGKSALWLEYKLSPAPWLKLDLASRLKTKSLNILEYSSRVAIKSGEFWEIGLSSYFKRGFTNQISLDYLSKISEKITFSSIIWADLRENQITRFKMGIDLLSKTNWRTSYSINYRDDQRRDKDLSLDIGLELLTF